LTIKGVWKETETDMSEGERTEEPGCKGCQDDKKGVRRGEKRVLCERVRELVMVNGERHLEGSRI
jgi:hypothetical protein